MTNTRQPSPPAGSASGAPTEPKTGNGPKMALQELRDYLDEVFPQIHHGGRTLFVEEADYMQARVRLAYHESSIRPGGTISGPAMFALADYAMYVAVLASIGPVELAVTTNMTINFLRRPAPCDLIAETRLIKLGKSLAVGEVAIYSDQAPDMVAHVTGTYSIPPEQKAD